MTNRANQGLNRQSNNDDSWPRNWSCGTMIHYNDIEDANREFFRLLICPKNRSIEFIIWNKRVGEASLPENFPFENWNHFAATWGFFDRYSSMFA